MTKLLFVMLGGATGASLRWLIGLALTPLFYSLPLGTLAVNWLGSFLIGCVLPVGTHIVPLSDFGRLFFITGFLGSLTTFSTFSGEVSMMLSNGQYGWMGTTIALHVVGSIIMTLLGAAAIKGLLA